MQPSPYLHPHWRAVAGSAAGAVAIAGLAAWWIVSRRPTLEQIEERRRLALATGGRIVDGVLTGADPCEQEPAVVFYTYRIAGVRYECSQNISALGGKVGRVTLDVPVQVRYLPANPGNSIVLAETWNGLWTAK